MKGKVIVTFIKPDAADRMARMRMTLHHGKALYPLTVRFDSALAAPIDVLAIGLNAAIPEWQARIAREAVKGERPWSLTEEPNQPPPPNVRSSA